jgi:hypothetical protein
MHGFLFWGAGDLATGRSLRSRVERDRSASGHAQVMQSNRHWTSNTFVGIARRFSCQTPLKISQNNTKGHGSTSKDKNSSIPCCMSPMYMDAQPRT